MRNKRIWSLLLISMIHLVPRSTAFICIFPLSHQSITIFLSFSVIIIISYDFKFFFFQFFFFSFSPITLNYKLSKSLQRQKGLHIILHLLYKNNHIHINTSSTGLIFRSLTLVSPNLPFHLFHQTIIRYPLHHSLHLHIFFSLLLLKILAFLSSLVCTKLHSFKKNEGMFHTGQVWFFSALLYFAYSFSKNG